MFKKKPNIKPLAPLRSSERRKIADEIIKDFGVEVPSQESHLPEVLSATETSEPALTIGTLRNSLLPENALSARFTTTSGPDLKQVSGTVYAGAHPGEDQRILWFRVEDRLLPTVYTLWRHPQLVPLLHTQDHVVQKLRTGSSLMTPGLARGPPFPQKAKKGAVVAVASLENSSVPLVVGVCEIDIAVLQKVQGARGHAVRSEHWDGDELWAWSTTGKPGDIAPQHIEGWEIGDETGRLDEATKDLAITDQEIETDEGGVLLPRKEHETPHNEFVEGEDAESIEMAADEKELSTKDIDDAFWQAFLYGIYDAKRKHKNEQHYGLNFPIPQTLVISNLVLPYLPIHSSTRAAAFSIKKTSWKNAKKFIKALNKAQILKSKDRDGGECVVLDVDFDDIAITNFTPYKLPKKEIPNSGFSDEKSSSSQNDLSLSQSLQRLTIYRAQESLSPLFGPSHEDPKALYQRQDLRIILTSYIEKSSLISPTNKRLVNLDPFLSNTLFGTETSNINHGNSTKNIIPRDDLLERVLRACSPYYAILRNDTPLSAIKPRAGTVPNIAITLETRSGKKTVTKVSGVELYFINPHALAEELQKACAGATSVTQMAGSSPKAPVMEVLVQGPQRDNVVKALERRGVRSEWVSVVDKIKRKKP